MSEIDLEDPEIQAALGISAKPHSLLSEALGLSGDGLDWGSIASPVKRGRKPKNRDIGMIESGKNPY